jgi:hypothetical protein
MQTKNVDIKQAIQNLRNQNKKPWTLADGGVVAQVHSEQRRTVRVVNGFVESIEMVESTK